MTHHYVLKTPLAKDLACLLQTNRSDRSGPHESQHPQNADGANSPNAL